MSAAEQAVIGLILREPTNLARTQALGLKSESFLDDCYRKTWDEIIKCDQNGQTFDLVSLGMRLGDHYPMLLVDALDAAPVSLDVEYFASEVIAAHWKVEAIRKLSYLGHALAEAKPFDPLDALKDEAYSLLSKLTDSGSTAATWEPTELCSQFLDDFEKVVTDARHGKAPGVTTGIKKLDEMIGGWMPSTFNVVGARTSRGKTTLAVNFALYAADAGHQVAYFTIEMRATRILAKLISRMGSVVGTKIITGSVSDEEIDRIQDAIGQFARMGIRINDKAGRSIETIEAEAWRLKRQGKLDLLIIDYVQQLHSTKRFHSRQAELNEITGRLQGLAMKLGIPIVVLAQLNREAEKLPDNEYPTKAHLKDSGSIEQDADVILLIHREDVNDPMGPTWLLVEKNRDGQLGPVPVAVDFRVNKFSNAMR